MQVDVGRNGPHRCAGVNCAVGLAIFFSWAIAAAGAGEDEEGDYHQRAKSEANARLAIQWQMVALPPLSAAANEKEAAKALLAALPAGDKPRLVFLESREQFGRPPKNTPQANACETMRRIAFEARDDSPHYQAQFAAKRFACFLIDVTEVSEAQNKFFCSQRAPVIIVADARGEISGCLAEPRNATANAQRVVSLMTMALARSGTANAEKILNRLNDLTRETINVQGTIYLLDAAQHRAKQALRDAQEGVPAAGKKPDAAAAKRAEQALREVEKKLVDLRRRQQALEREEHDLCLALGITQG